MQSETKEARVELGDHPIQDYQPTSFGFYEEYSGKSIDETIGARGEVYEAADGQAMEKLEEEVEIETENFRIWLEDIKKLEPATAYYCATGLKSLLLGLPTGHSVAMLFDIVLNSQ